MTGLTGQFSIRLKLSSGIPHQVHIESSRPVHASRVMIGKTVDEAMRLLPMLFSICGTAQACAGVRACEKALGIPWDSQVECQRELLVSMEAVREHLWRLFLDWPAYTNKSAEKTLVASVIALQKKYQAILDARQRLFVTPSFENRGIDFDAARIIVQNLRNLVSTHVFGTDAKAWLGLENPESLQEWAESTRTVAAALIADVMQREWHDVGRCSIEILPTLDNALLRVAFDDPHFVEMPIWLGAVCETNSYSRVGSTLLDQLRSDFGNGLLVRLVARLTDIALLIERLQSESMEACATLARDDNLENPGIGQAVAARGQLVHRVSLEDNKIGNYQILAPTEWNFHPQGVVSKALLALKGDKYSMKKQAALLIDSIDPCVGYDLHITG